MQFKAGNDRDAEKLGLQRRCESDIEGCADTMSTGSLFSLQWKAGEGEGLEQGSSKIPGPISLNASFCALRFRRLRYWCSALYMMAL